MNIRDGIYIVEVEGERHVAERCNDFWMQLGIDYDIWQYTERGQLEVKIIAKIDTETLSVTPV